MNEQTDVLETEEVKLEIEEEEEEVKSEPLDDEYFEQNIPKLEEQWELEDYPFSDFSEPRGKKIFETTEYNHQCYFCSIRAPSSQMKQVISLGVQGVILIGRLLKFGCSPQAWPTRETYVCYSHFREVLMEIFKILKIESLSEIDYCSSETIEEFKKAVSSLFPSLDFEQFVVNLHKFVSRNKHLIERIIDSEEVFQSLAGVPAETFETHVVEQVATSIQKRREICKVCWYVSHVEHMAAVDHKEKQLIVIGRLLRGNARNHRDLMRDGLQTVCRFHFEETLQDIFEALNIENLSEFQACSTEAIQEFMKTANYVFPNLTFEQFVVNLNEFVLKQFGKEFPINQILRRSSCKICGTSPNMKSMKNVGMQSEKMLIIIGCGLRGIPIDSQEFMEEGYSAFICHSHFREIYELCSIIPVGQFMITVNSFFPHLTLEQFSIDLQNFRLENWLLVKPYSEPVIMKRVDRRSCKLCESITERTNLKDVSRFEEKMLLTIGCHFQGTSSNCRKFMQATGRKSVCRSHFKETVEAIYNALQIENLSDLNSCSSESMEEFMKTVNHVFTELNFERFVFYLRMFVRRNGNLLEEMLKNN